MTDRFSPIDRIPRPASRTIVAPNGAKVRTRKNTRYVAVQSWTDTTAATPGGKPTARVLFGSDSLDTLSKRVKRLGWGTPGVFAVDLVTGEAVAVR